MSTQPEELWTAGEISRAFKIARSTVYQGVHEERIPHIRLGACVRFRPGVVQEWLEQQAIRGRAERVPDMAV